jgi:drug/metabolite transporter (DMT)-like permease
VEPHRPTGNHPLGLALSIVATVMWGVLPVALKITLEQMDAFTITWYRLTLSGVLLGGYLAARRRLPRWRGHPLGVRVLLLVAILGLAGNYICYLLGLSHTSPAASQVLIQLAPVLATLGALIIFQERFGWVQWCGFFAVGAGMVLFFEQRLGEILQGLGGYSAGVGLIVLAAVLWAAYALSQKQLLNFMPSSSILLAVYCASTLIFLPTADPGAIFRMSRLHLAFLAFCALNTLIAYGAFSEALAHWEASRVNATTALTPVLTLVMVSLGSRFWPERLASEGLSLLSCAGAVLVVAGSMSIALGNGKAHPRSASRAGIPGGCGFSS